MNIPVLNTLRGLAIIGVLWHHTFSNYFKPGSHIFNFFGFDIYANPLLSNGWLGVNLFFFCSGFVLYLPYCTNSRSFQSKEDIFWFFKHRAKRLLPLFYLSLIIGIGTTVTANELANFSILKQLAIELLCLFNFFPQTFIPIGNFVLWSLGLEMLFSVLFPFIVIGAKKTNVWKVLAISVLIGLIFRTIGHTYFRNETGYLNFVSDSIFGRADGFIWGMTCAWLYVSNALPRSNLLFYFGGFILVMAGILSDYWYVKMIPSWVQSITFTFFDIGLFFIVSKLVSLKNLTIKYYLEWKPIQILGMMCFSIYVWHGILLIHMLPGQLNMSFYNTLKQYPFYLVTLLSLSFLSYRYIEFPQKPIGDLFLIKK